MQTPMVPPTNEKDKKIMGMKANSFWGILCIFGCVCSVAVMCMIAPGSGERESEAFKIMMPVLLCAAISFFFTALYYLTD